MKCRNHPDREAAAVCLKHDVGFCRACVNGRVDPRAECVDPELYCVHRPQCVIREIAQERRKAENAENVVAKAESLG